VRDVWDQATNLDDSARAHLAKGATA